MKTVIVGGSAHSTPALFTGDWELRAPRFSFELVGRSAAKLAAVRRAIELGAWTRGFEIDCSWSLMEALDTAIAGADVLLVQFRTGGYAARAWDESFPLNYGVCGDEGLGPGGLAAAWRTWKQLRNILDCVARVKPALPIIVLTSPVGILTRCAQDAFAALHVYGICELPWSTLDALCGGAGTASSASYAYLGVNHIGWFADVRVGERRLLGPDEICPLKYVRLADEPAEVLAEQRAGPSRGRELIDVAAHAFDVYELGSAADIAATLARRPTPWYAQAVAPLLCSLAGDDIAVTYFLTARNEGYCTRFGTGDFIEMPFVVRQGEFERRAVRRWQRTDVVDRLERYVVYERLAAAAVRSRDIAVLTTALRAHPWLDGVAVTDALVADVVSRVETSATSFK